jgi:hypothetical protein
MERGEGSGWDGEEWGTHDVGQQKCGSEVTRVLRLVEASSDGVDEGSNNCPAKKEKPR